MSQIYGSEIHALLNGDIDKARESRGIAWVVTDILRLPDEMAVIKAAKQELENVAKQSAGK